jgi:hypothetical protein
MGVVWLNWQDLGFSCSLKYYRFTIPGHFPWEGAFGGGTTGGTLWAWEAVGEVVGSSTLVVPVASWAVPLRVGNRSAVRAVDRELKVIGAQSVSVGVTVWKQTSLQKKENLILVLDV